MLTATHRGAVPVRRSFLQTEKPGVDGTRKGPLAALVRDPLTIDAYFLIHAMASASEPYDTWFPSSTWAQIARLDEAAELDAAKARWAKIVTKLEKAKLLARKRQGNKMNYVLLHEAGNGEPYTRPTKKADGFWFGLPHIYWMNGWDKELSTPEKIMLIIALDQPDDFRMPTDRVPTWYGVSESTAHRGFKGLIKRGILSVRTEIAVDAKSPTGWKEILHYTTLGDWSLDSRHRAMSDRGATSTTTKTVRFTTEASAPKKLAGK